MVPEVSERLKVGVEALGERVQSAADFATAMERGPNGATPIAYVLPGALRAGKPEAAAGAFIQELHESVTIVLLFGSNDRSGKRALKKMRPIIGEVISCIAGWGPDLDNVGEFALTSGRLSSARAGFLAYTLEFTISDQLRIFT